MSRVETPAARNHVIFIPEMIGQVGFTVATIRNLPVINHPDGSGRSCVDPHLMDTIKREVFHRQNFFTRRRGLLTRHHFCRRCDTEVDVTLLEPLPFVVELALQDYVCCQLEITALGIVCPQCLTTSAVTSLGIQQAVVAALYSEGVVAN
ncbi:MAG: hypothetical protein ACLQVD_15750 [Capsulimonadaceae bacterium]